MGILKKWWRKLHPNRNEDSPSFRREMAQKLNGLPIKYVGERIDGVETVVGHAGALVLHDDELLVYSSSDIVFRSKVTDLRMSELLSKDGVILEGPDLTQSGKPRSLIAYFTTVIKLNFTD